MKKFFVFVLVLFLCGLFSMYGESTPKYVKMMKDKKVNFFDVKKEAQKYFKDKDKGKGSGWKQYKRWEYFWEQRLYPSGEKNNLADPVKEMAEFFANAGSRVASTPAANWVSLGPTDYRNNTGGWSPGLGRINEIVVDPNNSNIIYVGTPSGGLWRSTTGGNSWTPLTDHTMAIGVSCILIDHTDSNTIYIGTGDKYHEDCLSIGVLKSTDGGATWNTTGLTFEFPVWQLIFKMLMHPNDPNTLFAGTLDGLYKSTNGAASWFKVAEGKPFYDLKFKPGDPTVMYGATFIDLYTSYFYRSTDSGNTWNATSMTSPLRAPIAVTPANADYVYFLSIGLYRSTDSGVSFYRKGDAPTLGWQDWYDLAIAVSPTNVDEIHVGANKTYRTFNCGSNWYKTSECSFPNSTNYIHCGIYEMVYFGSTLYIGSSGLITKTDDSATSFNDLSVGLGIKQFFRMGSGVIGNPYKLMGGSQACGTSVYLTDHWHEWLGGSGGECVINYNNEDILYGYGTVEGVEGGKFYKSDDGGNNRLEISQPGGCETESRDWVTPFVIDPINPDTLYVGNTYVMKTTDGMLSWSIIGDFGLDCIKALAVAKSNPEYIYASKRTKIWRTTNGGGSWTEITGTRPDYPDSPAYYVSYISVHPSDPLKVAVTFSTFSLPRDGQKVFISDDAGDTWTNYSDNLPNFQANCVVYQGGFNDAMYVGMDVGVYYRDNTMSNWEAFMDGLPNVIISELEIDNSICKIRAATYGRGLWESTLRNAPTADFSASSTNIKADKCVTFTDLSTNNPNSWYWTFDGGSPSFWHGADPPSILYSTPGIYTVSLTVCNDVCCDPETKNGYITVDGAVGNIIVFGYFSTSPYRRAIPFTMPENGIITSVTMYHLGGSGYMILGVYEGEGAPQNLLGVTAVTPVSSSTGWQTIDLISPVYVAEGTTDLTSTAYVAGGTTVWLAWVYENNPGIAYETGSPGRYQSSKTWSDGMPDPFGSGSQANYIYSIYTTYTPGAPPQYTLTTNTVGNGTITLNPPGGTYDAGTMVTLTAAPDPGWQFDNWSGDLSGSTNPTTSTMNSNKSVTATFSEVGTTGTVGITTVYGSTSTSGYRRALPFTMPEDGEITSVTMYHTGGSGSMILAVYDGVSSPQNRLAVTDATAVSGSTGWQTINLTGSAFVASGSTVWLAWVYESNPGNRYQTGSPGRYQSGQTWSGGMPDPFGSGSQENYLYSIHATYTPGGGSPVGGAASLPGNNFMPYTDNNQLLIKHPTYEGSLIISIYNAKGDLVKKIMHNGGRTKKVNISDLPAGRYSAVLYNGQQEVRKDFVKE